MKGEIISVGTELLLGDIVDTNSVFIARESAKIGIDIYFISSVGDNYKRIQDTIRIASDRSDVIFITGGLGPTEDDLTKQVLSDFLEIPLYENQEETERLKSFFRIRGSKMPPNNLRQALIPEGAVIFKNKIGTASGLLLEKNKKYYFLLPGPPSEMKHIFLNEVVPWLKENILTKKKSILSHTLKFIGISESRLETKLRDLFINQNNPTIALLAKNGEIHCRLTAKVSSNEEFYEIIQPMKKEILKRVGEYCYGFDDDKLEEVIGELLLEKDLSLATAESCTGGLIAKRITDVPGSSKYFLGSVVAYDNRIKESILEVPEHVLQTHGAVSEETAILMAKGIKKLYKTDLGLSITGIAGPGGGTEKKPVGLVFIALVGENISVSKKYCLSGNREDNRWRSSTLALNLLRRSLE